MKKLFALLLTLCVAFCLLAVTAFADNTSSYVDNDVFNGTRFRDGECADPWVTYHDGYYYATRTGATQVPVYKSATLEGLFKISTDNSIVYKAASDKNFKALFGDDATVGGTWSPEIHYFSEEDFPGNSGWYMFVALKQKYNDPTGESSRIRMVVLKSTNGDGYGIYGHPKTGENHQSEPLRNQDGSIRDVWGCGQTILRISEGEYKGIYAMWVEEENRGTDIFQQKICIAKLKTPWQLGSEVGIITTPTQKWEMSGQHVSGSKWLPDVVEGATPIYGKNGEIFLIYSGSGYWTGGNYALGQLTWTGGDPLKTSSWKKLGTDKNPIFDAKETSYASGAGHSCFITDKNGDGFAVYHVYFTSHGDAGEKRRACIEPYYINYSEYNGAGYGVVHIGVNDNGEPADWYNTVVPVKSKTGSVLTKPSANASTSDGAIQLLMQDSLADGFIIYRKAPGEDFYSYYDTTSDTVYYDDDVAGGTYSYHVYSYRNEEISPSFAEASAKFVDSISSPNIFIDNYYSNMDIRITAGESYDGVRVYRALSDSDEFVLVHDSNEPLERYEDYTFIDESALFRVEYKYYAVGYVGDVVSEPSHFDYGCITDYPQPRVSVFSATCVRVYLEMSGDHLDKFDLFKIYRQTEEDNDWTLVGTTTSTGIYLDRTVEAEKTYYYQIAGCIGSDYETDLGGKVDDATTSHLTRSKDALDPTCTEDGYTAYTYCLNCDLEVGKTTLPAKGHSYEETSPKLPATAESEGKEAVYTCAGCGDSYGGETIDKLAIGSGDLDGNGTLSLKDVFSFFKLSEFSADADLDGDKDNDLEDVILLLTKMLAK